ncbi:isochorismatase family protein [Alicyclobacillus sp. ALC3]|uniref:isochorismatase family protein n=1 Tax=Alicyclobacillus sp. ALC3 TaxID=2796143 RepID=UPI00237860C1|nr:isochorismatase family protein [Alicyclobacillus sp. ALC3]WDL97697.1 isochorismatase family protein [Alicyclobacillus sp. ALC3]
MNRFQSIADMYRARGFSEPIGVGKQCAILVVDFINAFTDASYQLGGDLDHPVENVSQLLSKSVAANVPVIFTTTAYQSDYSDAGYWIAKVPSLAELVQGTPAVELDSRIPRNNDDILIVKKYASAFYGTSLSSILVSRGVDTVVVTGCTTSGCVRATTVDALQYGFRPVVLTDCVGDRDPVLHENSLFDLGAKYADLMTSHQLLEHIL